MVSIDVEFHGDDAIKRELRDIEANWAEGDDVMYVVGPTKEYAIWVEFGRGPVEADDADALRFEVDGEVIFRQSVGPAEPQPFMRPALRRTVAESNAIIASANGAEEAIKKLAATVERHAKQEAPVDDGDLRASIEARRVR